MNLKEKQKLVINNSYRWGKLILSQGLFKSKEYNLSQLTISKITNTYFQLTYQADDSTENVIIVLSALPKKTRQQLVQQLTGVLKKETDNSFVDNSNK